MEMFRTTNNRHRRRTTVAHVRVDQTTGVNRFTESRFSTGRPYGFESILVIFFYTFCKLH